MATDLSDLTANIEFLVAVTATKTLDLSTPKDELAKAVTEALTFGTGDDKADQIFHDTRLLAADADEDLDLYGGLTNAFGATINFAKIKIILIHNRSDEDIASPSHTATSSAINLSPGTNPFLGPFGAAAHSLQIPAGGALVLTHPGAGWTVTDTSADQLNIDNASASDEAAYDIVLIGESA